MKKVIHRPFDYQIPEKSGFSHSITQGFPRYIFVNETDLNNPSLNELLRKILSALNFVPGKDLEIISCISDGFYPVHSLLNAQQADLICFGIHPAQLQLQGFADIHHIYHFKNSKLLFAHSLNHYSIDTAKKPLWTQLKKMFGL